MATLPHPLLFVADRPSFWSAYWMRRVRYMACCCTGRRACPLFGVSGGRRPMAWSWSGPGSASRTPRGYAVVPDWYVWPDSEEVGDDDAWPVSCSRPRETSGAARGIAHPWRLSVVVQSHSSVAVLTRSSAVCPASRHASRAERSRCGIDRGMHSGRRLPPGKGGVTLIIL